MSVAAPEGILARYQLDPVDQGALPREPDDVVDAIMDPVRRGELYPLYHRLRQVAPVFCSEHPDLAGAWVVTGFEDSRRLARSPQAINDPSTAERFSHGGRGGPFYEAMRRMLLFLPVQTHARVRRLVVSAFTPRAIGRVRPIAQATADRLLDAVVGDGGMDLVRDFAYPLPIRVICHILGVPEADRPVVERYAWDFARAGEFGLSEEEIRRGDAATVGFEAYFRDLIAARRSQPRDDLLTSLAQANEDGDHLSPEELVSTCILLLQAGHETTADLVGNAVVALFRHPDQHARLRAEPELAKPAVEEFLRYDGSVQLNQRLLLDDLELGGVTIPAGDNVVSFLGAANRDPAQFPDPDRLDVSRSIPQHLAFSLGAYYCIGAALARTEIEVAVRSLLDRCRDLRPATDTFRWRTSLGLRGPQELLVAW